MADVLSNSNSDVWWANTTAHSSNYVTVAMAAPPPRLDWSGLFGAFRIVIRRCLFELFEALPLAVWRGIDRVPVLLVRSRGAAPRAAR